MAAALAAGIMMNHPFVDGNKRTGLAAGFRFLDANGYATNDSADEWVETACDVACHRIGQDELAARFAKAMGGDCPIEVDDPSSSVRG